MAIGLARDTLVFEFPEVRPDATLYVTFQRILGVPDDGRDHHLPPGLVCFPMRAVDELPQARIPVSWRHHGGVVLPMWQAEACWLSFSSPNGYPMALKIAAGQVNAVNGEPWSSELDFADQDYVEIPGQPWLDGFRVAGGDGPAVCRHASRPGLHCRGAGYRRRQARRHPACGLSAETGSLGGAAGAAKAGLARLGDWPNVR